MHKKLITACLAIAAIAAFVVPAALASPVLTSNGTKVPIGTSIEYKNTGNIIFSGGYNFICTAAVFKGTVTANSGTQIKSEIPVGGASFGGTGTDGECTSPYGDSKWSMNSKLCLETNTGADTVKITGCGASVTFTLNVTSAGFSCQYETASPTGTYNTNATATVNLNTQPVSREGTNIFCLSTGTLTMDFDLYTTNGTLLTIS